MINTKLSRKGSKNGMYGSGRFGVLNPFFGKKHSSEAIERNRLAHLGKKLSEEHKEKIRNGCKGINRGMKSPLWKGDNVSYAGLHRWVERELGKSNECSNCGGIFYAHSIEWANRSGKYHRNTDDWIRLCRSCHRTYDHFNRQGLIKS